MKGFLNKYMEERRGDQGGYDAVIKNFKASTDYVLKQLGEKPFHLRGRLNYGALDSIMALVLADVAPEDLDERFEALKKDEEYDYSITFNTSDEATVEMRMAKALEYLSD